MKLAVCSDSQEDRAKLSRLIEAYERKKERYWELREFESAKSILEADEWVRECSIVFMNINTKDTDGLDAAKRLKETYPELYVILVSAHMSCAVDGYRVKAARFLIKEKLDQMLPQCLDEVLQELAEKENKILFSFVEGERLLDVSGIFYIETDRHKNIFYMAHASYRMYRKLDELEKLLAPYGFVRVHRSFLVNMRYVRRISSYVLYLTDGTEISVPKSRYAYVKQEFAAYQI